MKKSGIIYNVFERESHTISNGFKGILINLQIACGHLKRGSVGEGGPVPGFIFWVLHCVDEEIERCDGEPRGQAGAQ